MSEDLRMVRLSTAGSVDDGKSTLIGRLLYDTKSIFEDQYEAIRRMSEHRGESEVNLALLTDGLRAEREQGITIDVAYRYFATPRCRFIIADTPGHQQYTRNMITGASTADVAVVLVDARNGLTDQSKRHAFISSLLRIPQVIVLINKMDLVEFSEARYNEIKSDFLEYADRLVLGGLKFIPASALLGDNVVEGSTNMPWYRGQPLLETLEDLSAEGASTPSDLRLPIQYVLRPDQNFRGFAGKVSSGVVRPNEELMVLPSGQTANVVSLNDLDGPTDEAGAGDNVVVTLDKEVDLSRGDMLVRPRNLPSLTQHFEAVLCWMTDEASVTGKTYLLRHTTREVSARLEEVVYRFDIETLHRQDTTTMRLNDIGRVVISTGRPIFLDTFEHNRSTGSFLLIDSVTNNVVAAGMVTRTLRQESGSKRKEAEVIWLTGLSGAGKSTLADAVVEQMRLQGIQAERLDGDDLRTGLNSDLGFTPEARSENLRRAAHVAKLYAGLGNVTLCSFITPLNADRRLVREIVGDQFYEVFIKTSLGECERRDPKGLYKKARAGTIPQFTGISSVFEEPENPELVVETENMDVETAARLLLEEFVAWRSKRSQ
ncbi:MAG TPA: adenylyl-sulfate kinase [Fimbriimonadaceae bacterium]